MAKQSTSTTTRATTSVSNSALLHRKSSGITLKRWALLAAIRLSITTRRHRLRQAPLPAKVVLSGLDTRVRGMLTAVLQPRRACLPLTCRAFCKRSRACTRHTLASPASMAAVVAVPMVAQAMYLRLAGRYRTSRLLVAFQQHQIRLPCSPYMTPCRHQKLCKRRGEARRMQKAT